MPPAPLVRSSNSSTLVFTRCALTYAPSRMMHWGRESSEEAANGHSLARSRPSHLRASLILKTQFISKDASDQRRRELLMLHIYVSGNGCPRWPVACRRDGGRGLARKRAKAPSTLARHDISIESGVRREHQRRWGWSGQTCGSHAVGRAGRVVNSDSRNGHLRGPWRWRSRERGGGRWG